MNLKENVNSIDEFKYLYDQTFPNKIDKNLLVTSFKNTLYSVSVYEKNQIVGYGRLLGDGILYIYIHNIMVLPKYQKKGIGTLIMKNLLDKISLIQKKHPNLNDYLGSFRGKENFYRKFGFITREEKNMGSVMMLK